MTNQKAIGELSALMTRQPDYAVALDKAISALEAQELSKNSTELDKENGDLQPTCNQLATDCISRQAAVDWLNNEWDGMVVSLFDGIRKLPSAQPESQWIPVAERLPEEGQSILVTADGWRMVAIIRTFFKDMHKDIIGMDASPRAVQSGKENRWI